MPEIKFTGGERALFAYLCYFSNYYQNDQKKSDINRVNEISSIRFSSNNNLSTYGNLSVRARKSSLFSNINPRRSSNFNNPSISLTNMEKLSNVLKNVDDYHFNIFELEKIVQKQTIHFLLHEVFERYIELYELVNEKYFKNFLQYISGNYYRTNPYHNDIHAGDVFQTVYVCLLKGNIVDVSL